MPGVSDWLANNAGSLINAGSDLITNAANYGMWKQNFDYQRALQQQVFDREDTAWQRGVQDIQKAGLSTVALSGGAQAGSVVGTTPMQFQQGRNDWASAQISRAELKQQKELADISTELQRTELGLKREELTQSKLESAARIAELGANTSWTNYQHDWYSRRDSVPGEYHIVQMIKDLYTSVLGRNPSSDAQGVTGHVLNWFKNLGSSSSGNSPSASTSHHDLIESIHDNLQQASKENESYHKARQEAMKAAREYASHVPSSEYNKALNSYMENWDNEWRRRH